MSEIEAVVYFIWMACGVIAGLIMFFDGWPLRHESPVGTFLLAVMVATLGPISLALALLGIVKR